MSCKIDFPFFKGMNNEYWKKKVGWFEHLGQSYKFSISEIEYKQDSLMLNPVLLGSQQTNNLLLPKLYIQRMYFKLD